MTATAETTYVRTADPVRRQRLGIAAVTLAVTGVIALVGGVLWPEPAGGDWYAYADVAPIRDRWWTVLTVLAVSAAVAIPLQALAAMALVRQRGAGWATWGGAAMFLGTGLQVTGVAGWAALYYFATDPSGDPAAVAPLLETAGDDLRLFGVAAAGALIVALGTAAQAVGLWRSGALPRWVPIVSLAIVPTFFLPNSGPLGLITGIPISVAAAAIGYYAWRRAA
jgi:hypothetical protein